MNCKSGCSSRPDRTVHLYVHSRVITQLCRSTAGVVNTFAPPPRAADRRCMSRRLRRNRQNRGDDLARSRRLRTRRQRSRAIDSRADPARTRTRQTLPGVVFRRVAPAHDRLIAQDLETVSSLYSRAGLVCKVGVEGFSNDSPRHPEDFGACENELMLCHCGDQFLSGKSLADLGQGPDDTETHITGAIFGPQSTTRALPYLGRIVGPSAAPDYALVAHIRACWISQSVGLRH
jgi:hypothetical protein